MSIIGHKENPPSHHLLFLKLEVGTSFFLLFVYLDCISMLFIVHFSSLLILIDNLLCYENVLVYVVIGDLIICIT